MGRAGPGGPGKVPGTRGQIFEVDLFGISVKNWTSYVFLYKYDWAYGPAPFGLPLPGPAHKPNWHWKLENAYKFS